MEVSEDMLLKGDIIRVLSLGLGRLWLSELVMELDGFRASLGECGKISKEAVLIALDDLREVGIVDCDDRLKSRLNGESVPDKLISLLNYPSVAAILKNDARYSNYLSLRRNLIGSPL